MKVPNCKDEVFHSYSEYREEYIPEPGRFLEGHRLLKDEDHVGFHERTWDIFEERGVYDVTFGYNLAKLNLDRRHPDAGYRYAENSGDSEVLRAEFTPTTEFCPQAHTLALASYRAWNDLADRHPYREVRVRVDGMHQNSDSINDALTEAEADVED